MALQTVPSVVRLYGLVGKDMFFVKRLLEGALNNATRYSTNNALLGSRWVQRLAFTLAPTVADIHRCGIPHGELNLSFILTTEPLSLFGEVVIDAVHVKLVVIGLS